MPYVVESLDCATEEDDDDDWKEKAIKHLCSSTRVKSVGSGQYGCVYRVNIQNKVDIAVKIIQFREETEENPRLPRRKDVEREAQRNIQHHHVLQVYDMIEVHQYDNDMEWWNKYMFLALDFIPKGDMTSKPGSFGDVHIRKMLVQCSEALNFMFESQKYVHRDIKPENILLRSVSKSDLDVVIADMGLTRSLSTMKTNVLCGTSKYIVSYY